MDRQLATSMETYHLHRAGDGRPTARAFFFLAAAALLWVGLMVSYSPMRIMVDGVSYKVPAGTTAAELVEAGLVKAPRGDLRSLTGQVAKHKGGMLPTVVVDGTGAGPSDRISDGATITSVRGKDVTEAAVTTIAATPIPVQDTGRGPDVTIESIGTPGLAVVKMGVVSHSIVESRTIVAAKPMRIRRTPLSSSSMVVALTFDDGPWPGQTAQILDILEREDVKATFFVLGVRVRQHPEMLRREIEEGHTVGSHSMTHPNLTRSAPAVVHNQMAGADELITSVTGVKPVWFRAPGGSVNAVVQAEAAALGERVIRWTADPNDWRKPSAGDITARVMGGVAPGAVILLHDGGGDRRNTIAALPEIIRQTRERGFRFVTLDEMYAAP